MDIEREIELLKEKVRLLEAVRDLQEKINILEKRMDIIPIPYYPPPIVYPYPAVPYSPWYVGDPPSLSFTTCEGHIVFNEEVPHEIRG